MDHIAVCAIYWCLSVLTALPAPFKDMWWLLLCSKKTEIGREYDSVIREEDENLIPMEKHNQRISNHYKLLRHLLLLHTTIFDIFLIDSNDFKPSALGCKIFLNEFQIFIPVWTLLLQDNSFCLEPPNSWLYWTISVWGMHFYCYEQSSRFTNHIASNVSYYLFVFFINWISNIWWFHLFCRCLPAQLVSFSLGSCLSQYGDLGNSWSSSL